MYFMELKYFDVYKISALPRGSLFLLYGQEEILKDEITKKILSQVLPKESSGLSLEEFSILETRIDSIINALNTSSFFSPKKVIILKNIEELKSSDFSKLSKHFPSVNSLTYLILVNNLSEKKLTLPAKVASYIEKNGIIINCSFFKDELSRWIKNKLDLSAKVIDKTSLQQLIDITGGNLSQINSEIERLVISSGDNPTLSSDDISSSVATRAEGHIYNLTDALGERKIEKALGILHYLLKIKFPPEYILNEIRRYLKLIWQAKVLIDKGILTKEGYVISSAVSGAEELLPRESKDSILRRQPWIIKKHIGQASFFSEEKIISCLHQLFLCELSLKGIKDEKTPDIALESLILKLGSKN